MPYAIYKDLGTNEDKLSYICHEIKNIIDRDEIINKNSIVCIYLWDKNCEPCKKFAPTFANIAKKYNNNGKCLLAKEDIKLNCTTDCEINAVPLFIFYRKGKLVVDKDGKQVDVVGGNEKEISDNLDMLLSSIE